MTTTHACASIVAVTKQHARGEAPGVQKRRGHDKMLHPQIQAVLAAMQAAGLRRFDQMTPAEARAQTEATAAKAVRKPVGAIEDRSIAGSEGQIPVRIYHPDNHAGLPAIVYFHGGGHVVGSLDSHDATARALCAGVGAAVISVDYRMGPEHKFPAAAIDSFDALRWVAGHAADLRIDGGRIGVAGDSAGANLAAVVAIMARDAGGPPLRLQSLVYPVVDYAMTDESYLRFADGFGNLTRAAMSWFQQHYLRPPADAADWRASPIRAKSLAGVAPAIITAAECDVLVDEGKRYADALRDAGVPVSYHMYPGMIHGFFGMVPAVDDATKAQQTVCAAFREAFA
jgi:acetyl esterase